MSERINLPKRRVEQGRPIHVHFRPQSFPGQRFALRMEWNSILSRWTVEIEHLNRERLVTKGVATPYRLYNYMPWCLFLFADPTGEAERVTPETLQDEVFFFVHPGPDGQPPEEW